MKGPHVKTTSRAVIKAAAWGAIVFAAVTVLAALFSHLNDTGLLVAAVVLFIPIALFERLGLDHTSLSHFILMLSGIPFCGLVNAVVGAFIFALVVFLWRLFPGSSRQNGGK